MSDFDELDDILISLRERRERLENGGKPAFEPPEAPAKSRSQRAKEEQERLEKERLERERQERLEKERLERERQECLEKERLERERRERLEKERLERERQERLEKERLERERQERLEKERLEREKQERLEKERLERERQERLKKEQAEREEQLIKEMELEAERNRQRRKEQEEREALEQERAAAEAENQPEPEELSEEPPIDKAAVDKVIRKHELEKRKKLKRAVKKGASDNELEKIKLEVVEEKIKPLEPPKPATRAASSKKPDEDVNEDDLVWITADGKKPKKKITKKDLVEGFKKAPSNIRNGFKNSFIPALKRGIKSTVTKQLAIFLAAIVAVSGAIVGGYRLYDYSKVAYLKPFQQKYPDVQFPQGILEDMCGAYGENQTVVGRLQIADTDTDKYATYQRTNDFVFAQHSYGVIDTQQFLAVDINGAGDIESVYSTGDGFLNSTQLITYSTLFEKNTYKVIAAYYTNLNPMDDRDYTFPYSVYGNMTEKSFTDYADKIESRRLYDTGYTFSYADRFITVSASSDFMTDFKFVVVGVLVDEEKFVKSETAVANENVHYPQIWYDVKFLENPYRFSKKWYPEIYTDSSKTSTKTLTADDFAENK